MPTQWQLSGNFKVNTPAQKATSRISWQQQDNDFIINLYTLFGVSVLNIEGTEQGVSIDGKPYPGRSAEQLVYQMTGWQLPVNDLKLWLLGRVDNARDVSLDPQGNFNRGLINDRAGRTWQLDLSKYKTVRGRSMPHKISLQHSDIRLKLAVSSWKIHQ